MTHFKEWQEKKVSGNMIYMIVAGFVRSWVFQRESMYMLLT